MTGKVTVTVMLTLTQDAKVTTIALPVLCTGELKTVLNLAGIDTYVFKAHSYRGASVSMAVRRGCSLQQVLKTAD